MVFTRRVLFVVVLVSALAIDSTAQEKTENRQQAVLRTSGEFLPNAGGYKVSVVDPNGPCARMEHPTDAKIRGIMDVGDVILKIDGKPFRDRRDLFDLLNEGNAKNGKVRLTVRDVNSGKVADWIVTPVVMLVAVPVKRFDLLNELPDAVPAAPAVPAVSPVLKP